MTLLSQPLLSHNIKHLPFFESTMLMTTDADDFDNDEGKPQETADDIAMRAVTDFYANWKCEGAIISHEPLDEQSHAQSDLKSHLYSKDVIGEPTDITSILRRALPATLTPLAPPGYNGSLPPSMGRESRFSRELLERRLEVRALADKLLGSRGAAQRWFATPFRHQLMGNRPIDFMESVGGCDEVERFLLSLYPPATT
ncbi:MbcA/ParS/Xre antitoxin family protein [Massilia sp. NP310]|uniref:MbcA/ParS/Xre antitoxin family protein n=1 Tax=Massilia sp. NP310 TaxID=2861282 RepID=UPI001C625953|nr:MbcA/ParS/Xre antitoxin family protein [Massilia sp. NP310]QYF99651.1 MbcA/ParS/Xre antitoxin family protein [Massilia sp. NP310]